MNKKIINNAISAYFGLGALLLLPSKKENINHPFVKKHARTALFIHVLMFLNYLIFISFAFLSSISLLGFNLNHIFASIIFIGLFGWILYGVSKANSGSDFSVVDMTNMAQTDKIIEIKSSNLNEQGVLTIILSLIPFIGFSIKAKFVNYKSPIIENNAKLNIIITFLISSFFAFGDESLGLLFGLFYLIFIGFYSILLITKQKIISINLEKIPTLQEIYIFVLSFFEYLKNYFSGKKFISLKELNNLKKEELAKKANEEKKALESLEKPIITNALAYIPYINLISLIDINSKNRFHIINGLILTILSLTFTLLDVNNLQIFLVFLIFFGIGYLKKSEYKFPFLFDIYAMFAFIFSKIFSSSKKVVQMQKVENEVSFKVE